MHQEKICVIDAKNSHLMGALTANGTHQARHDRPARLEIPSKPESQAGPSHPGKMNRARLNGNQTQNVKTDRTMLT